MKSVCVVPLLLLLVACTSFPEVEENSCGNFVLEAGEDCDSSTGFEDGSCGQVGGALACFQTCDSEGQGCPEGWGCGADSRCRQASGDFVAAPTSTYSFPVDDFRLGDVDGDGNLDVIGNQGDEVHVLFGDEGGIFSGEIEVSTQNPLGPMVFGNFDGDERLDVVVPTADGILVLLGSPDRSLQAKTFVSAALGPASHTIEAVEVADNDETELLVINETAGTIRFHESSAGFLELGTGANSTVAGTVVAADLTGTAVPEFVVPIVGAVSLQIFESSGSFPRRGENTLVPALLQTLALPAGTTMARGVQAFDVDSDGDQDLLLSLATPDGEHLFVASNAPIGDAVFGSPTLFQVGGVTERRGPLAIADLNADLVPDFVFRDGVYISNFVSSAAPGPIQNLTLRAHAGDRLWDSAVVADFNGDGHLDVGAGSSSKAEIKILLGLGNGLFNPFVVESARAPKAGKENLVVGDFDGDFVQDLAFAGISDVSTAFADTLEVVYGASSGGFASPTSMGELEQIQQILPVQTLNAFGVPDSITDIVVISETPSGTALAKLRGTSSRRMVSPYVLSYVDSTSGDLAVQIPTSIVMGDFSAPAGGFSDLLAIARDPVVFQEDVPTDAVTTPSVWLIPGLDGDGNLDAAPRPTSFSGQGLFREECAKWISGNIDGPLDVLIGIDGSSDCYRSAEEFGSGGESAELSLLVAKPPVDALGSFELEPFEISDLVGLNDPRELLLVDFDNDGAKDLLSVFAGNPFAGDQVSTSGTVVFWNVGGAFTQGRIDTEIGDYASNLRSVRAIHLNADTFLDWIVIADDGVYTAVMDPETKYFSLPILRVPMQGARVAEVGDVNRDGVDDMVVLSGVEIRVLLGVPRAPQGGAR